jgi:hypothetical protein
MQLQRRSGTSERQLFNAFIFAILIHAAELRAQSFVIWRWDDESSTPETGSSAAFIPLPAWPHFLQSLRKGKWVKMAEAFLLPHQLVV